MSTKGGVRHWKHQRVTAMAAIPLMLWLVWSVVSMQGQGWSYDVFTTWLSEPVNAGFMALSVVAIFYHAALGVQVIVEDYVHNEKCRSVKLLLSNGFFIVMTLACLWSICEVACTG